MLHLSHPNTLSFNQWLAMTDVRQYLVTSAGGVIPLYWIGGKDTSSLYLASVLLPRRLLRSEQREALLEWGFSPYEALWGYSYYMTNGKPTGHRLTAPFERTQPAVLQKAIPIIIARENSCYKDRRVYFELNPQIAHVHDLHWMEERSAYCTLDVQGDIRDVVSIATESYRGPVTIAEDVLMKHLLLGDLVLVRFFDVDRRCTTDVPMPEASDYASTERWDAEGILARWTPIRGVTGEIERAFLRGYQIIAPPRDRQYRRALRDGRQTEQYCTFLTHDWKHNRVAEVSCDPNQLGNYFVESPYPFGLSPAFFKREVLLRYQSDSDKYSVEERTITCRSLWSLSYDINASGQVQVYLKDLSCLAYQEQLYWKSFNEPPNGGLSQRSLKTDFLGEWYDEPNPLRDLKRLLEDFPHATTPSGTVEVWQRPTGAEADLAERIHYLATKASDEWERAIVVLNKLIVEGLNLRYLRRLAEFSGLDHAKLGSIMLLKEVLTARGIAEDLIRCVIEPLRELQELRSQFASHRKGDTAAATLKRIRRQYKDLATHYTTLVAQVYEGMTLLAQLVVKGDLHIDAPP